MSKTRRIATHVAIVLGAALLVIAVAVPTYVVPKLKAIPLDTSGKTTTETTKSILLSSAALAKQEPSPTHADDPDCKGDNKQVKCFIDKDVDLYSSRYVTAQEPSNNKKITLQVGNTVMRANNRITDSKKKEESAKKAADKQDAADARNAKDAKDPKDAANAEEKDLVSATVDRITLNRRTAFPVKDPVSTISINSPTFGVKDSTAPFTRDGYQYQFPFGTERRSYQYFDMYAGSSTPIDFVDALQQRGTNVFQDGVDVYQFSQDLGPVNLYDSQKKLLESDGDLSEADKSTLATLRLNTPGKLWGLDTDDEVQIDRYYVNTRTINVEPTTGVITMGEEKIWMFYAQNYDEAKEIVDRKDQELANPTRTALYFDAKWDQDSQNRQLQKAHDALGPLKLLSQVIPWATGVLGILLFLGGLWLYFGSRSRTTEA